MPTISIAGRKIGGSRDVFIVAELSANHQGEIAKALQLVRAAKECGADAVKVQTYTADTLTIRSDQPWFRIQGGSPWAGRTLHDLYTEAFMPWAWQPELKREAENLGLVFFSTPFDDSAVDFLESLGAPAFKIASFELVDPALIRRVARTGKPAILSTGMASLGEIDEAVRAFRNAGGTQLALLKCTSAYPARPEDMNLRTIPHLSAAFDAPVGISDHTLGIAAPVAAAALGACIIEKHLTLSRSDPGPDSAFSLEPAEFKAMADAVRAAVRSLGTPSYGGADKERASRNFRRSLFVVQDMKAGERFNEINVRSIRPGAGLPPSRLPEVLGRTAARDIVRGTPLEWRMIG